MSQTSHVNAALFALTAVLLMPSKAVRAESPALPRLLPLPNGFQPEGVTAYGLDMLAGSLLDGDIYRVSVVTGRGVLAVDAPEGRTAVGIEADRLGRVFVAGGPLATAYVYDVNTGEALADYQLAEPGEAFINDVVVAHGAAYFTDSNRAVLYRLPLHPRGDLPQPDAVEVLELTGPAASDIAAGEFNLNGIEYAPWARALIAVNFFQGVLYRIDPATGQTARIDLGGGDVVNGDGIVLRGLRLYVVRNFDNAISVVHLQPDLQSGVVVDVITDPEFRVPTTADLIGPYLFAVNARFDVAPPPVGDTPPADPTLAFDIVRVSRFGDSTSR